MEDRPHPGQAYACPRSGLRSLHMTCVQPPPRDPLPEPFSSTPPPGQRKVSQPGIQMEGAWQRNRFCHKQCELTRTEPTCVLLLSNSQHLAQPWIRGDARNTWETNE